MPLEPEDIADPIKDFCVGKDCGKTLVGPREDRYEQHGNYCIRCATAFNRRIADEAIEQPPIPKKFQKIIANLPK